MRNPKKTWDANLQNIKNMHWLHEQLVSIVPAMDLSDLLRSEHVLIVSAFDCYIHDVVLSGMTEMFNESKKECKDFTDFCIPMSTVKLLLATQDSSIREEIYNASVKRILSKDSYQSPKSVEFALGLINLRKVWKNIGDYIGKPTEEIKRKLGLIIQRRNKIAHEADIDNFVSMEKTSIDRSDVYDVFSFLGRIVNAIEHLRTLETQMKI